MAKLIEILLFSLIPLLIFFHLYISPYTKVEESFNIQAAHDILKYGVPVISVPAPFLDQYDHFTFPGAVPRTFVGALLLSNFARPFIWLYSNIPKQFLIRALLGAFNSLALISYARAVRNSFGKHAAAWYILFQVSQFHVIYYTSRTLPNMFAFGITTFALRSLLPDIASNVQYTHSSKRYRLCLYLLTIAGIVFRSEIAILLATTTIYNWALGNIRFRREIIPPGIAGVLIGLSLTVLIDSFFWQKFLLWPEFFAFKYNVISGNASDWGVQPWHFYFTSALPRLLLNPLTYLICIPLSCIAVPRRQAAYSLLCPSLAYIALYSLQPHKEWRFVIYTIPPLTTAAALGASYIWIRRNKSITYRLLSIFLVMSTLAAFALSTLIFLPVSMANYPGAQALNVLHDRAHNSKRDISVHMDTLTCQTGVTHFLEMPAPKSKLIVLPGSADGSVPTLRSGASRWHYDKTEDEGVKEFTAFWDQFDYALVENENSLKGSGEWKLVEDVLGFGGVQVLRPGEDYDGVSGQLERDFVRKILGNVGVKNWGMVKQYIRKYITRGWWVGAKMVPKIKIMEHVK